MANIMYAHSANASRSGLTVAKFTSMYSKDFPVKFTVCKGYYGPSENLKFSEGDKFRAHSVKQSQIVTIEYDSGQRENISINSWIPFAILYDPHDNPMEAMKGYRFEKISELMQLSVLPPVLWSRKAYQGSSPESSISANELLIVRGVKTKKLVGKQQLKVYSLTHRKEKTLYSSCVGSFSTKPRDTCLLLSDILKLMKDIFPCRAVMFNSECNTNQAGISQRNPSCIITMMHSSIETSLVISSTINLSFPSNRKDYLEIPIDLNIMVKIDTSPDDNATGEAVYEDTSLYSQFDERYPHSPPPNTEFDSEQPQFYTNVHFGQERSKSVGQAPNSLTFSSAQSAVEQGHYQTPTLAKSERTSSNPIAIESIYHPPNDQAPDNYVHMVKNPRGSQEVSPTGSGTASSNGSPSSTSWRPPLPPPNKIKKDHRSPGYAYVETDLKRSTRLCNESHSGRCQATDDGDSSSVLSTSVPDSANSVKSFDSSGSGGAVVERRGSVGSRQLPPGSGDGIVERQMRSSSNTSNSSAGLYSYAKTNHPTSQNPSQQQPTDPTSPNHYSHLRSRSGPPVTPQLPPLSSLIQRPVATTRLDTDSDSLVVVQRHGGTPAVNNSSSNGKSLHRQESAPVISCNNKEAPNRSNSDPLSSVIDDLDKMTQELGILEENIFTPDDMSPTSESANGLPQKPPPVAETREQQQPALNSQANLPPELIEKHKNYLKAMDNYQVLKLLEAMGLEQYTPTFKHEQINGDILSTCDDGILKDELKIASRLHRIRLLRVIDGNYSIHDIMSGHDGYIFMSSVGKQQVQ